MIQIHDIESHAPRSVDHHMRLSLLVVAVVLFLLAAGLWFAMGRYAHVVNTSSGKIDSLYRELGLMRGENTTLHTEVTALKTELDGVQMYLTTLEDLVVAGESGKKSIRVGVASLKSSDIPSAIGSSGAQEGEKVSLAYPDGVINVLLIGTHSALTDTIMVVSINPDKETVSLVSVPRDLYVNGRKINEIYHYHGVEKLKLALLTILGLNIDYHAVVDMNAFKEVVDSLGGIDVTVAKDIYDYQYPTANKGYQVYSIKAGAHHMDGEQALKFARSRKSTSDFDRAARQQQVIEALKERTLSFDILKNPKQLIDLYNSLSDNVHTNIDVLTALDMMKRYRSFAIERGNVLDSSNYLYSSQSVGGAYILLPRTKNYDDIKTYVYRLVVQ